MSPGGLVNFDKLVRVHNSYPKHVTGVCLCPGCLPYSPIIHIYRHNNYIK